MPLVPVLEPTLPFSGISGLTAGRLPVAATSITLTDSALTVSGNALDIAAAGLMTFAGSVATSARLGGTNLTGGLTLAVGSGQNVNFQAGGTTTMALSASLLQWAAGGNRTFNIATAAADTQGHQLSINPGNAGVIAASNGQAGGQLFGAAGTGAAASGTFTAGGGGQNQWIGGSGGAGTATLASGNGGPLLLAGGAPGTNNGGGQGNGGSVTIRGGAGATNGSISIGATNTSAVGIGASSITTTITGGLTQLTGAVSITGNAASSISTSSGNLTLDAAATLNLGTSAATSVSVGKSGAGTTINGSLTTAQAQFVHRTTVANVNYTTLTSDYLIAYSTLTAARVVTGTVFGNATQVGILVIKDESGSASSTNTITFTPASGTIDGASSKVLINTPYDAVEVYCNGTNFWTAGYISQGQDAAVIDALGSGTTFTTSFVSVASNASVSFPTTRVYEFEVDLSGINNSAANYTQTWRVLLDGATGLTTNAARSTQNDTNRHNLSFRVRALVTAGTHSVAVQGSVNTGTSTFDSTAGVTVYIR